MRKTSKPFLILFAALLLAMSFPMSTSEWFRGLIVGMFSPLWELFSPLQVHGHVNESNHSVYVDPEKENTQDIKEPSVDALAARIIFRSPSTWNSSMWINVGEESNEGYAAPLIAKNSPVLIGDSVVGVVDYVGKKQSRVRLITDSGLVPSVRVARGYEQNKAMTENITDILAYLRSHPEMYEQGQNHADLEESLLRFQQKLLEKKHTWHLAKGEIRGKSYPSWRTDAHLLQGSGFNYDFEDDYGPARDLRSGEPTPTGQKNGVGIPLVKVNDLLVTTGMDGVFPPGLKVATVTKIEILREGDYAFELEAKPTVGNLDNLTWVYVIPPLGYDEKDQAPIR